METRSKQTITISCLFFANYALQPFIVMWKNMAQTIITVDDSN